MKAPKPLDLPTVLLTFEAIPELAGAGVFAGANALYLEHIENPLGRFSLDIDLQNQTEEIEAVHRRLSPQARKKLKLAQAARASDNDYNPAEFLRKLQSHHRECVKSAYAQELPVRHPPAPTVLREFLDRLMAANQAVAQATLKSKPTQR